jgi:hypothetical protein
MPSSASKTGQTVETFPTHEEAEADLQHVLADEPELAVLLRVEPVISPTAQTRAGATAW